MRLLVVSVAMIVFGWMAEIDLLAKLVGFSGGMVCWLYILYEIFAGEASACAQNLIKNRAAQSAFNTLRLIVSVGWCIYPIGFGNSGFFHGSESANLHSGRWSHLHIDYGGIVLHGDIKYVGHMIGRKQQGSLICGHLLSNALYKNCP